MSNAITPIMPVMDIEAAVSRRNAMVEYVQRIMVSGVDYGTIPGTGSKPTLLKPGAEKLSSLFALRPSFPVVEAVQDWTGAEHGGEPFFSYWYKCILWRGDEAVGEGDASCNSWEKKYRYRKAERACPNCGALAIAPSKYAPKNDPNGKPGWYCRDCKKQFTANDPAIKDQTLGYVPNVDVADQVNTLQKMAQKRALIAAVLVTCNASEFFTQDLEDIVDVEVKDVTPGTSGTPEKQPPPPETEPDPDPVVMATAAQLSEMDLLGNLLYGDNWLTKRAGMVKYATGKMGTESENPADLTEHDAQVIIDGIRKRLGNDAPKADKPVVQAPLIEAEPEPVPYP